MLVYHGSNSNFKQLRISKSLVKHDSTLDNEGLGIYFTTDYDVARSYGRYVYTLEINNDCIVDFRNINVCKLYLSKIVLDVRSLSGIDLPSYCNLKEVAQRLNYGGLSVQGVARELSLILDSNENWYRLPSNTRQKVVSVLNRYKKPQVKVYMFNYNIKNCGVIKDVSSDVVKIVNKD